MEALTVYEQGLSLELAENWAGAKAAYAQSLEISPRPIVHYHMGVVLGKMGEYESALTHLDKALELAPTLIVAEREKVRIRAIIAVGRADEAGLPALMPTPAKRPTPPPIETVETFVPKTVEPEAQEEAELIDAPVEAKTMKSAPTASRTEQTEFDRIMKRGYDLASQGDVSGAIEAYRKAKALDPEAAQVDYNLGCLHQQRGELKEAYLSYHRAIELDSGFAQAWNNLGFILEQLSRSEEALDCYEQAIASGGSLEALYNAGLLYEKRGDAEQALKRFRSFLEKGGAGEQAEDAKRHIARLERRF